MTLLYNGIQYEIENENDGEGGHGEAIITDEGADEEPTEIQTKVVLTDTFTESVWEPPLVHLFLKECIKKKSDLLNPKVRRRKVFTAIRDRMKEMGYRFRVESLDRKLRNLKTHYLSVKEHNKASSKRTHWQYYEELKEIYPKESNGIQTSSFKKQRSARSARFRDLYLSPPPADVSSSPSPPPSSPASPPGYKIRKPSEEPEYLEEHIHDDIDQPNGNFFDHPNKMEGLRRKILSFEERRTIAAEKILNELKESNRMKRELLDLSIKMFKVEQELEDD